MSGEALRQAIAALRSARPVRIDGEAVSAFLSVETGAEAITFLDPDARAPLLISGWRAAALGLTNQRESADPSMPVLISRETWLDGAAALRLADAAQDFARAPIGPLRTVPLEAPVAAAAGLRLARDAGLLPALWLVDPGTAAVKLAVEDLGDAAGRVEAVSRARLPLQDLPETQIAAFRSVADGQDHVALIVGAFGGEPPLVRMHSECLTGDVFGSLKCDCGLQLKEALRLIGDAGGGVLLYLRQEGRGIGLANKLRAYALQDRGLDTVEANIRLGFDDDERGYANAAAMLRALGIDSVRLLTNNPAKVDGLERAGIRVVERVAHHMPTNPHNADYIATKRAKSGHLP